MSSLKNQTLTVHWLLCYSELTDLNGGSCALRTYNAEVKGVSDFLILKINQFTDLFFKEKLSAEMLNLIKESWRLNCITTFTGGSYDERRNTFRLRGVFKIEFEYILIILKNTGKFFLDKEIDSFYAHIKTMTDERLT